MSHEQHAVRRIPLAAPILRQRVTVRGHALSALLHGLVVAVLVWGAQRGHEAMLGPGEGPGRGGGGGGSRVFRVLLPAGQAPKPPEVAAVPEQLVIPREVQKLDSVVPPSADTSGNAQYKQPGEGAGAGAGPGSGTGTGGGAGAGTGSGVGPDSGGGGGRIFPPQLQVMLIPPMEGRPAALRGVQVTVMFEVSERGQVLSVETNPEIRDRGYRNSFLDKMRRYTFTPGLLDGRPVRARTEVRIRL
ncbi:MAG: hypothetical protein A2085_11310 [Gemmatimonadetes bacterium GWC2_71_10]|nr:MAG: hypothetical protein A2085_11310 [Gemmatimonadetes bacterium GWC2_71_10]